MSIQTFDEFLNPTNHPSDSISTHLELENSQSKTEVMGNWVYDSASNSTIFLFQQHVIKAGRYLLHTANQDGAKIDSSPFSFTVVPAAPSAPNCMHNLVDEVDSSKVTEITIGLSPYDKYNNLISSAIKFEIEATFDGTVLLKKAVLSDQAGALIPIQEGSVGTMEVSITLNGKHIKDSPHRIKIFAGSKVLDSGTAVTAVLGGGAFLFLSFIVYIAVTKKGRENVMDEVTEARKCMLPLVLDLVDIATDVGE